MERLNKINKLLDIKLSNTDKINKIKEEKAIMFNNKLIETELKILKYCIETRINKLSDFTKIKDMLRNMIRINSKEYNNFESKAKAIEWLTGIYGISSEDI